MGHHLWRGRGVEVAFQVCQRGALDALVGDVHASPPVSLQDPSQGDRYRLKVMELSAWAASRNTTAPTTMVTITDPAMNPSESQVPAWTS